MFGNYGQGLKWLTGKATGEPQDPPVMGSVLVPNKVTLKFDTVALEAIKQMQPGDQLYWYAQGPQRFEVYIKYDAPLTGDDTK